MYVRGVRRGCKPIGHDVKRLLAQSQELHTYALFSSYSFYTGSLRHIFYYLEQLLQRLEVQQQEPKHLEQY